MIHHISSSLLRSPALLPTLSWFWAKSLSRCDTWELNLSGDIIFGRDKETLRPFQQKGPFIPNLGWSLDLSWFNTLKEWRLLSLEIWDQTELHVSANRDAARNTEGAYCSSDGVTPTKLLFSNAFNSTQDNAQWWTLTRNIKKKNIDALKHLNRFSIRKHLS